ncbi:hypothetical protein GCM10027403_22750 [Arthrobacter tecti]
MNRFRIDETFSRGLRETLVSRVEASRKSHPAGRRRRRRWQFGAGVIAAVGLAGGAGAATAGFFHIPGSDIVTQVSEPTEDVYTGTTSIELGPAPEDATHIFVELTCLSAGTLYWEDGASSICSAADPPSWGGYTMPLQPGQHSTKVRTSGPEVKFRARATYVNETPTEWAVNENGHTYGGPNDQGEPDLLSVFATNGQMGYVYRDELNEASGGGNFTSPEEALAWQESMKGKTATVPVYKSDGETVIGEFVAGSW